MNSLADELRKVARTRYKESALAGSFRFLVEDTKNRLTEQFKNVQNLAINCLNLMTKITSTKGDDEVMKIISEGHKDLWKELKNADLKQTYEILKDLENKLSKHLKG